MEINENENLNCSAVELLYLFLDTSREVELIYKEDKYCKKFRIELCLYE